MGPSLFDEFFLTAPYKSMSLRPSDMLAYYHSSWTQDSEPRSYKF